MGSVVSPEDVMESLKNDGTVDTIRLKIFNHLKTNEELKNKTISMLEQCKVLSTPGAEKQTKRELFEALRAELETQALEKVSKLVWDLILDNNSLGKEIAETIEKVFCRLSGCERPPIPLRPLLAQPPPPPPPLPQEPPQSQLFLGQQQPPLSLQLEQPSLPPLQHESPPPPPPPQHDMPPPPPPPPPQHDMPPPPPPPQYDMPPPPPPPPLQQESPPLPPAPLTADVQTENGVESTEVDSEINDIDMTESSSRKRTFSELNMQGADVGGTLSTDSAMSSMNPTDSIPSGREKLAKF